VTDKIKITANSKIKINDTIQKITKILETILKTNPDYCGSITINFYLGGVTSAVKKEGLKIK